MPALRQQALTPLQNAGKTVFAENGLTMTGAMVADMAITGLETETCIVPTDGICGVRVLPEPPEVKPWSEDDYQTFVAAHRGDADWLRGLWPPFVKAWIRDGYNLGAMAYLEFVCECYADQRTEIMRWPKRYLVDFMAEMIGPNYAKR